MTPKTYKSAVAAIACACALLSGCGGDDGGTTESARALPRLTGLTLSEAEQRLQSTPVEWTFQDEGGAVFESARESSEGTNRKLADRVVIAQDPKAGARVVPEDIVLLKLRR